MDGVNLVVQELVNRQKIDGTCLGSLNVDDKCPICGGLGYLIDRRNGEIFARDCVCEIRRRNKRRIERSRLGPLLEHSRFETFETPESWQLTAKEAALRYLEDWRGKWFFIGGAVGAGKTHLCAALCGELMSAGVDLRFFEWRSDSPVIKALINDPKAYRDAVGPLKTIRALYIDDFLKGGVTDADKNLAFEILNARYNNPNLATIISSEKSVEQLLDWDEAVGSRIFERSKGFAVRITGTNKNWRLKG